MIAKQQWIQGATISVDSADGSLLVGTPAPATFSGGSTFPEQPGVAEPLVSTPTPCQFVWIGAAVHEVLPEDEYPMWTQNQKPLFLGDAQNQNIPIFPKNYRGIVIRIRDASLIHVRALAQGDGVAYRISAGGPPEES